MMSDDMSDDMSEDQIADMEVYIDPPNLRDAAMLGDPKDIANLIEAAEAFVQTMETRAWHFPFGKKAGAYRTLRNYVQTLQAKAKVYKMAPNSTPSTPSTPTSISPIYSGTWVPGYLGHQVGRPLLTVTASTVHRSESQRN